MASAGEPLSGVHVHSEKFISFSVGDGTGVVVCLEVSREWVQLLSSQPFVNHKVPSQIETSEVSRRLLWGQGKGSGCPHKFI